MSNDPFDSLSALAAGIEEMQARDAANQSIARQALQAGEITRDQYDEFLAMPHAKRTQFAAGLSADFVNKWTQTAERLRLAPWNWAGGIFGEPVVKDPQTGAWETPDVRGNFNPFGSPQVTGAAMTGGSVLPASRFDKVFTGKFGAATPKQTPHPAAAARGVLMQWPDGVIQRVSVDRVQHALEQGAAAVL